MGIDLSEEFNRLKEKYFPGVELSRYNQQYIKSRPPEEWEVEFKCLWLGCHHRTEKERTQIRKKVTESLIPLLTQHGFVKVNSTFLRICGDYLLQIISVNYPASLEPSVSADVFPLYDIFDGLETELPGIRAATGWEGLVIEQILGISNDSIGPSYLAYREDFDVPIEKELNLLRDSIIPMFDRIRTTEEYLDVFYPGIRVSPDAISPLLRAKKYSEAKPILYEFYTDVSESLQKHNERRRADPLLPEHTFYQKKVDLYWYLLQAVEEEQYEKINDLLNSKILSAYQTLARYSKTLVKRYPLNARGDGTVSSQQTPPAICSGG